MKPMKLTDVGPEVAEQYINDPDWIMQQKHDGARMLVIYQAGELLFTNDGVKPIAFSAAKLKLPALEAELREWFERHEITAAALDGELIIETGVYHLFDAPVLFGVDLESINLDKILAARLAILQNLAPTALIQHAVTAHTRDAKRTMWEAINTAGVEGAVSKHLGSRYEPGTRTTQWVKHKLVKTADVVVTSAERTFKANGVVSHGKAELAVPIGPGDDPAPYLSTKGKRLSPREYMLLPKAKQTASYTYAPRELLPVGNASLIGKDLTIEPGSVVEVNYLYWTGDAMIQPRIMRKREDKTPEECDLTQFPTYTREVVTLGTYTRRSDLENGQDPERVASPPEQRVTAPAVPEVLSAPDEPRSGRGPSGKLRNFDAMGDAKFEKEAAKIEAENNDPEALEAIRVSRAQR